jgi:D-glycero-alpha-D-manno-heptose-7-phosphate kinase
MIVSRAPLRVSFLGGGTDYPDFFELNGGLCIGASINKYVFVFANGLPEIAEQKIRFTYRKVESVAHSSELEHPVLKAAIPFTGYADALNIATMSDIPGRSGLGSSSAFSVATLNALYGLKGISKSSFSIAEDAVTLERKIIGESGGWQDQYISSIGGLRSYYFTNGGVEVSEQLMSKEILNQLSDSVLLIPTGSLRYSSLIASKTAEAAGTNKGQKILSETLQLTKNFEKSMGSIRTTDELLQELSSAVNTAWKLKTALAEQISNKDVQDLIDYSLSKGCLAAKLCGAGGSGFVLVFTPLGMAVQFNKAHFSGRGINISFTQDGASTQVIN